MLVTLLPSASPKASAEWPSAEATIATVSSGADVAQAAIVIATSSSDMRQRAAVPTTPRTNISPPIPARRHAASSVATCTIIGDWFTARLAPCRRPGGALPARAARAQCTATTDSAWNSPDLILPLMQTSAPSIDPGSVPLNSVPGVQETL